MAEGDLVMLKGPNGYYYVAREGAQGKPGLNGTNGNSVYIAFANDASGSGLSHTLQPNHRFVSFVVASTNIEERELEELFLAPSQVWVEFVSPNQAQLALISSALSGKQDKLPTGSNGHVWTMVDGGMQWAPPAPGGGGSTIQVDSSLNSSSTNPVQNKAVWSALSSKAGLNHSHAISKVTGLQDALTGLVAHVDSFAEVSAEWISNPAIRGREKVYICRGENTTDLDEMLMGHIYHLQLFPQTYEYTYEDTQWEAEWVPGAGWSGHWEEVTETVRRISSNDLLPNGVPRDYFLQDGRYVSEDGSWALYATDAVNQSWFVYDTSISDIASLIASSNMNPSPEGVYDLQFTPSETEVCTGVDWVFNGAIVWHAHTVTKTATGITIDYLWRDITPIGNAAGAVVIVGKTFTYVSDYWKENYSEDGWENAIVIGDIYDSSEISDKIGLGKIYKLYFYKDPEASYEVGEDTEPQGVLRLSLPGAGTGRWYASTNNGSLTKLYYAKSSRRIYAHINRVDGANAYIDYLYENITKPEHDYSTTVINALSTYDNLVEPGKVYHLVMEEDFTLETEWDSVSSYGESVLFVEPGEYTFSVDEGITLDPSVLMTSGYRYRLLVSFTPFGVFVEQTAEWEIPAPSGQVTLTFSGTVPTGAGWTIDGQTYTSGQTATLSPGTYAITYASVTGYDSPSTPTSVTVAAGDTLTLSAEYTEQQAVSSWPASFTLSTSASGLAGTWTLLEGTTTEYNGDTHPVYQNGSQYLAMRSDGKPHINSSADVSQTSLWRPSSYTAGAAMSVSTLSGNWNNPNDDDDATFTFTEA